MMNGKAMRQDGLQICICAGARLLLYSTEVSASNSIWLPCNTDSVSFPQEFVCLDQMEVSASGTL